MCSTGWPACRAIAPLDVALLPVWGWGPSLGAGHMDPRRAAEAAALLRPRLAMPIHWGTLYPLALHRVRPVPLTDPPHLFARFAASLAPDVDVRIVAPGGVADARRPPARRGVSGRQPRAGGRIAASAHAMKTACSGSRA